MSDDLRRRLICIFQDLENLRHARSAMAAAYAEPIDELVFDDVDEGSDTDLLPEN